MKRIICLLCVALFILGATQHVTADVPRKSKKTETVKKDSVKTQTPYDKLMKKPGAKSAKSDFITLHKIENKLYLEIPFEYFNREMLLASTLSETSNSLFGDVGYKANEPIHVKFVKGDSVVYLKGITTDATADPGSSQQAAVNKSFGDAIVFKGKIEAYSPDKKSVVVDMTDLFTTDMKEFSFLPKLGLLTVKGDFKKENSDLGDIKSFSDNFSISSYMTYKVSISILFFNLLDNVPVTGKVTRSFLLLPEEKMKPRIADSRVGIFLTDKQHVSTKEDGIQKYSLSNRWRLEPKDVEAYRRGELVEPVKPIVYYIDDAFPAEWRESVKQGVLTWNAAFEKIGFKNVMEARDFPKDDPAFDPDNLKYSCIRYLASDNANAMGPSWVDPTTGEIMNATVLIYNDVIRLVNNWRFIQTAQVDPRVRSKKLPEDVMRESMVYIVAHEVGHTLGFMHNMSASAAFPVDSLRSASFTQKNGTTPTIMDYARFNYVAQPQDKGVKLTPPTLGEYDYFLIKWNYQYLPDAKTPWAEQAITEQWVDEKAGNPVYRYGRQQIAGRYDPSAIEEDLGDDPIKASNYGIKNLKYILANLDKWIDNDADYKHREGLYKALTDQYFRYITNVSMNVGGIYLTDVKEGTAGERYRAVPKEVQKASLAWVMNEYRNCGWVNDLPLKKNFSLKLDPASDLYNKLAGNFTRLMDNVILSSHIAENPYKIDEFLTDLYTGTFDAAIKGKKLTEADRLLERTLVNTMIAPLEDKKSSGGLFGLSNAYAPSVDEILAYDLDMTGFIRKYENVFRQVENEHGIGSVAQMVDLNQFGNGYGFVQRVDVKNINESEMYLVNLAFKTQQLIASRVATTTGMDKIHYQALNAKIKKVMKNY